MRRTAPPVLAALAAAALLTGCAAHGSRTPSAVSVALPASATTSPAPDGLEATPSEEPTETDDISAPIDDLPVLTQVWLADPPRGTGTQIAMRFLRALQRHDDIAADRELYAFTRQYFSGADLRTLRRALNEVRRNAGLDHAAPCSRAVRLGPESALVSCGRLRVVVHVLDDELAHGVQIGDWSLTSDLP